MSYASKNIDHAKSTRIIKYLFITLLAAIVLYGILFPSIRSGAKGAFIKDAIRELSEENKQIEDGRVKLNPIAKDDTGPTDKIWFDLPILYFSDGGYALIKQHCTHVGWLVGDLSVLSDKNGNIYISEDHFCTGAITLRAEGQPKNLDAFLNSANVKDASRPRWIKYQTYQENVGQVK